MAMCLLNCGEEYGEWIESRNRSGQYVFRGEDKAEFIACTSYCNTLALNSKNFRPLTRFRPKTPLISAEQMTLISSVQLSEPEIFCSDTFVDTAGAIQGKFGINAARNGYKSTLYTIETISSSPSQSLGSNETTFHRNIFIEWNKPEEELLQYKVRVTMFMAGEMRAKTVESRWYSAKELFDVRPSEMIPIYKSESIIENFVSVDFGWEEKGTNLSACSLVAKLSDLDYFHLNDEMLFTADETRSFSINKLKFAKEYSVRLWPQNRLNTVIENSALWFRTPPCEHFTSDRSRCRKHYSCFNELLLLNIVKLQVQLKMLNGNKLKKIRQESVGRIYGTSTKQILSTLQYRFPDVLCQGNRNAGTTERSVELDVADCCGYEIRIEVVDNNNRRSVPALLSHAYCVSNGTLTSLTLASYRNIFPEKSILRQLTLSPSATEFSFAIRPRSLKNDEKSLYPTSTPNLSPCFLPRNIVVSPSEICNMDINDIRTHPNFNKVKCLRGDHANIKKQLGSGSFGQVNLVEINTEEFAVKIARDSGKIYHNDVLMNEAKICLDLSTSGHKFVTQIRALIFGNDDWKGIVGLAFEYCAGGDLKKFLDSLKQRLMKCFFIGDNQALPSTQMGLRFESLTELANKLETFAAQVAKAMKFISDEKFVHRDIAARNILLKYSYDDPFEIPLHQHVKITDFGLCVKITDRDSVNYNSRKQLPFKWLPYEFFKENYYGFEGDVWEYGCFLIELLTLGGDPQILTFWSKNITFRNDLDVYLKQIGIGIDEIDSLLKPTLVPILEKALEVDRNKRVNFATICKMFESSSSIQNCPQARCVNV
uniref:Protein kinase domain-containing protein n=1 Tax=Syphacia muris TaxID=451379 RepID=A0A0N5AU06_9BILA